MEFEAGFDREDQSSDIEDLLWEGLPWRDGESTDQSDQIDVPIVFYHESAILRFARLILQDGQLTLNDCRVERLECALRQLLMDEKEIHDLLYLRFGFHNGKLYKDTEVCEVFDFETPKYNFLLKSGLMTLAEAMNVDIFEDKPATCDY